MNKKKILAGVLSLSLLIPIISQIHVRATRDRTLDQMVTDSFVIIDDEGNSKIVQLDTIAAKEEEISVADKYEIVKHIGGTVEVVDEFATEEEALEVAELMDEEVTVQAFSLRSVDCGVVYIKTSGVTEYKMVETGQTGYTSGAYGGDAAFIGEFNGKIRAKYAGVIVDFNPSDVNVVSFDHHETSYYMEEEGILRHYYLYGSSRVYASTRVGYDLPYLEDGVMYYSYDGHYFYESYPAMIQDYQEGSTKRAINASEPYYNYYQFLSHRSLSPLTGEDLDAITQSTLSQSSYQTSKFYQIGQYFVNNQNEYYVNAMLMYGVGVNESNWGRSSIAHNKNNLFGHGANDSNPYWDANGYASVNESIKYHAFYFISRGYLDYKDWRHFGPHLGDKESGLNVKYASDPYWGEKAACRPYFFDEVSKDYGIESIGIIQGAFKERPLYNEPSVEATMVTRLTNLSNIPVLILEEVEVDGVAWYKIASDTSLNEERTSPDYSLVYRPDHDYLYIQKEYVQVVNVGESLKVEPENPVDPENPDTPVDPELPDIPEDPEVPEDEPLVVPELSEGHRIQLSETYLMCEIDTNVSDILAIDASAVVRKGVDSVKDPNALVGTGYTVEIKGKTYTIIKAGDVTGDGKLSPSDYVKVKNHIMETSLLIDVYIKSADMNLDGKISPADYVMIKNTILSN